LTSVFLKF